MNQPGSSSFQIRSLLYPNPHAEEHAEFAGLLGSPGHNYLLTDTLCKYHD